MNNNGIIIGVAIGLVTGAVLANNCSCVRNVVDDTQRKVVSKLKNKGEKILSNPNCECAAEFSDDMQYGIQEEQA